MVPYWKFPHFLVEVLQTTILVCYGLLVPYSVVVFLYRGGCGGWPTAQFVWWFPPSVVDIWWLHPSPHCGGYGGYLPASWDLVVIIQHAGTCWLVGVVLLERGVWCSLPGPPTPFSSKAPQNTWGLVFSPNNIVRMLEMCVRIQLLNLTFGIEIFYFYCIPIFLT